MERRRFMRPVLLIAFKFPPYAGVGAFRWSKFAKYLARLGHTMHVVTVEWQNIGLDTLREDVEHQNIRIHRIASGFPHNEMHSREPGPEAQFKREQAHALLKTVSFDNEAVLWGRHLLPYCKKLINAHNIEVVVATGPPFHCNVWAARLKTLCPRIRLIQDFRDTWLRMPGRSYKKRELGQLALWLREAVDAADLVPVVSPTMMDMMREDAPSSNYAVIRNAFDPEIARQAMRQGEKRTRGPVTFCYLGSLGSGRLAVIAKLLDAMRLLGARVNGPALRIFSGNAEMLLHLYPDLVKSGQLEVHAPVAPVEALGHAYRADFGVTVRTDEFKQSLQTKMYDYIGVNTPCLSIGTESDEIRLLREYDCGISTPPDPVYLAVLLRKLASRDYSFSFANVRELGVDYVAGQLSDIIEHI
ncbi:glycosyltransferase [Desulfolutivibrio sulfoxidireducens]|nr:glycosyltransferase [Desulfolutivibrio sulfoxidireducens]